MSHTFTPAAVATALTFAILAQNGAALAQNNAYTPTPEQQQTARQVAMLLDRAHYLDMPMDEAMSGKILAMYFHTLDPNKTLFLQSDIDEFMQKYGKNYALKLKQGDLSAGIDIYKRYEMRSKEYYKFAKDLLKQKKLNLDTKQKIITDRENEPYFKNKKAQTDYWQNQTLTNLINLILNQETEKARDKAYLDNPDLARGQDLIKAETRTPAQIMQRRLARSQEQMARLKSDDILEQILNSAMQAYDPHSNYFAPIAANEMQIQSNLELEGIGISIRPDRKNPDYTRIVSLVDGGPAAQSGQIRPNDLILGVAQDGEPMVDVVGFSTREIVALIRGKRGTNLTLKVKQPNTSDAQARNVALTRDVIKQEESGVHHRVVDVDDNGTTKRMGVIEIPSFYLNFQARRAGADSYRSVSDDTEKAINALNKENIDGLVIDLRGNPGGSLDEVAKMLGLFIGKGPVVQIRDNQGKVLVYENNLDNQLYSGDMVVLVNLASASASEIFAAAIQDYGRGLVVGSTTTGKGSAQVQRDDLALGSVNLTQRKFYRVTGGSTQNKGVVPDVELVNIYEGATFGERDYKNPLPWDTIETAPFKPFGKYSKALIGKAKTLSQLRQKTDPQFVYLSTLNQIRAEQDDKKPLVVNLTARRARAKNFEQQTLAAENLRRQATGEAPYTNYAAYQASLDAQFEEWGAMKENERPKLPEDEAYIKEAARVMFDSARPITSQP